MFVAKLAPKCLIFMLLVVPAASAAIDWSGSFQDYWGNLTEVPDNLMGLNLGSNSSSGLDNSTDEGWGSNFIGGLSQIADPVIAWCDETFGSGFVFILAWVLGFVIVGAFIGVAVSGLICSVIFYGIFASMNHPLTSVFVFIGAVIGVILGFFLGFGKGVRDRTRKIAWYIVPLMIVLLIVIIALNALIGNLPF